MHEIIKHIISMERSKKKKKIKIFNKNNETTYLI